MRQAVEIFRSMSQAADSLHQQAGGGKTRLITYRYLYNLTR